jgi:thiamine-phosphate pyrophosphorylase
VLRYAITSRALLPGNDRQQQAALVEEAARWVMDGIDLIQLREKDLSAAALADLARNILKAMHRAGGSARLLINSRLDIALAVAADGVHLTSSADELTPAQVRRLYADANLPAPLVTVSCHTLAEVVQARDGHADGILFAPVFEKTLPGQTSIPGQGLERLRIACAAAAPIPVYALGGVTLDNASACVEAGAAGIAGIRLFHDRDALLPSRP